MGATYIQEGGVIDYTPSSAVSAGDVVVQGELVGVAQKAIAADALGAITVEGVFDFPKTAGASTAITAGANAYWDASAGVATTDTDTGTNKLLGKVVVAATDDDTTVRVRLNQ